LIFPNGGGAFRTTGGFHPTGKVASRSQRPVMIVHDQLVVQDQDGS
jgi:hypothetical protein